MLARSRLRRHDRHTGRERAGRDETGRAVRNAGITGPVAGKTGTTNNGTDVWFVGYTPTVVAGFWFGYDTPRSLGEGANGGRLAAPAWADFYRAGWRERGSATLWKAPSGLLARDIDPQTGLLAASWCSDKRREWFKPGTEPTEYSCEQEQPAEGEWTADFDQRMQERIARVFRKLIRRM